MIPNSKVTPFDFESRGVSIRISGNLQELVDWSADIARHALLDDIQLLQNSTRPFTTLFEITIDSEGIVRLTQDGRIEGENRDREMFKRHLNSLVRVAVAEHVGDRLFIHAGAVSWKGNGIIFPGDSYVGKSTVVRELITAGADYLSDDYAIFDEDGGLYEFPRTLTIRSDREGGLPGSLNHKISGLKPRAGHCP